MVQPRRTPNPSPLADLERAFRQSTRGPAALAVDGLQLATDLPARPIPLDELRRLLLHGALSYETKDRVLGQIAARAQAGDDAWVVAFAGLLMPGLKRVARRLRRTGGVDAREVGSEVVVGLLEALAHLDPCRDRIAASVCWEVYRRAYRATAQPDGEPLPISEHLERASLAGLHPEEIIARAVRAGVVTPDEAELVAATRIEHRAVSEVARSLGLPRSRLAKRRLRAEIRIAELLRREADGTASDTHRSWWPSDRPVDDSSKTEPTACAHGWRPRSRLDGGTTTAQATSVRFWESTPVVARPLSPRRSAA
jgi:hypothetical protein